MINNSKILTVSYGTFSCTLEGFEDSFGTMKAIAEYFRDLAADDRYFGAEPPQPDAEMLARIAEREAERRVSAREQDGQIVLSALDEAQPPAQTAIAATPLSTEAEVAEPEVSVAEAADDSIAIETEAAPAFAPLADTTLDLNPAAPDVSISPDDPAPEQQAASAAADAVDLAAESAPVEAVSAPVEDVVEPFEEAEAAYETDDEAFAEAEPDLPEDQEAEVADVDMPDIVPGQSDAEVEAFFASAQDKSEDAAPETPSAAPVAAAAAAVGVGSIAAKLQRIRDVVAQRTEDADEDPYVEDYAEEDVADPVAEARADIEDALDVDDALAATPASSEPEDELTSLLSRVRSPQVEAEPTDAASDDDAAQATDVAETAEAVGNLFNDEPEAEVDEPVEAPAVPRARVIKVKRAELEAAIEKGGLEEVTDEDERDADEVPALADLAPAKSAETELSAEDEAELAEELGALADEINAEAADQDDTVTVEPVEAEAEDEALEANEEAPDVEDAPVAARRQLPAFDADDAPAMNRLLAETDQQMDEPEGATRRDAFAHLRAAVKARKGDAAMEADEEAKRGSGPYRADLAEVVRPRRPASAGSRTERPTPARPAPLKLVAEQRVDLTGGKSGGPVRPRRVAKPGGPDAETPVEEGGFTEFAAEMGAHELPDLLEAAAAYMSFVEGREQFSRPQLMSKVRQAGAEAGFSREEGLRSFGQLLRAGKIEKIKGGRFTVSDEIGFRPDERAAG